MLIKPENLVISMEAGGDGGIGGGDSGGGSRWFLCDSAICLLVAGVDTLGGREGEP